MKKALLVRFGGLGDLLVVLPSIRFLRAKFPAARLTLVSRKRYGELLLEAEVVDEIMPEDDRRLLPLFGSMLPSDSDFAGWLRSFDLIMAWTQVSAEDFLSKAPGIGAGRARPCIIQAVQGKPEPLSLVFFRKTIESLGETSSRAVEEWSRLPLTGVLEGPRPNVVVHPGSGSEAKRWPLRNFLTIIDELGKKGITGALITGEAEENLSSAIEKATLPLNWTWIRCPSIAVLARLLKATGLYLGNDSGVTHLAASCGAKVVALFLSENALTWRPLGRVQVLSAVSMREIRLETVRKIFFSRMIK